MVTTITLNPCIDKTITIDGFKYGGMNRVLKVRCDVSGKGINTAIVMHQMNSEVNCIGINYENGFQILSDSLKEIGIYYDCVVAEGTLRENIKVFDQSNNVMTEFNQKGHYIDEKTLLSFESLLEKYLDKTSILVISGSVPQGVPADYYYKLIKKANAKGVKCFLDAEGELLLNGVKAKPYLIKPNLYEFETAFGLRSKSLSDILPKCREIIADGIQVICLSMGKEGALIVDSDSAFLCRGSDIEVKGVQGAGDSMVAGICIAMESGLGLSDMLRYAVSAAHGSLIREGTQLCQKEDFDRFLDQVEVERINE